MKLLFVAAAALLDEDKRVLVQQRPPGKELAGLWEFPGGKTHAGETPEAALVRELSEELGLRVSADALEPLAFASHAYPDFHLVMLLYACRSWEGEARSLEGQALRWAPPRALRGYAMPPADIPLIAPLVAFVEAR